MTDGEIYSLLTEVFRDAFFRDDIVLDPGVNVQDIEHWDSFKQIEILVEVEQRFGIKLHAGDLGSMAEVKDLVAVIKERMGQSSTAHAPSS